MLRINLLFWLLLTGAVSLSATTFNVTNLMDSGAGSLRQAIADANADASATADCPHQIVFALGGTVNLTGAMMMISEPLEIRGHSTGTILDGGSSTTVFRISESTTLLDLTIQNATKTTEGGAIFVSSTEATFIRCSFLNNSTNTRGGAIYSNSGGQLTLLDCLFDGNFGAKGAAAVLTISSYLIQNCTFQNSTTSDAQAWACVTLSGGTGTVKDCYFFNNTAVFGGALRVDVSVALIEGCLFEANSVTGFGRGGAMYLSTNSTNVVRNCTFESNTCINGGGGAYIINSTSCSFENNTFSNNSASASSGVGGAISAILGTYNYTGNIFYNNSPIDIYMNSTGNIGVNQFNIVGACAKAGSSCPTFFSSADPLLGALTNNGGLTKTMEPGAGSVAIDAMGATGASNDQRGYERGSMRDIGAFEKGLSCNCAPGSAPVIDEPGLHYSAIANTVGNTTYYCDASCNLLLGLVIGTSGAAIPANGVEILIEDDAEYYANGTGFIANPNGGAVLPRSWDVNPTIQPSAGDSVGVILFLTANDLTSIDNALTTAGQVASGGLTNYQFYKVNAGATYEPVCETSGTDIVLLPNGANASTSSWTVSPVASNNASFYVTSFSGLGGGAGAGGNALPVEWLYFSAEKSGDAVVLDWGTATEVDNLGYHIERSKGERWERIGFMPGEGDLRNSYRFVDSTPEVGVNYYRIVQEDFDGSLSFTAIKAVEVGKGKVEPVVFPNPVTNNLSIRNITSPSTLSLYHSNGQLIYQSVENQATDVDVSALSSGIYFLEIKNEHETWRRPIVKK